jgi:hypothetical protein
MAEFPPAVNGTEQRLDVLIAEIRKLNDVLNAPMPELSDEIQLREPVTRTPHPNITPEQPTGRDRSPVPVTVPNRKKN